MKRDSGLCLGLFLGFILLLLGMLFEANGGDYRDHTVDARGSVKGKPEDGGRKPEDRGQRTEDGRRKTEDRNHGRDALRASLKLQRSHFSVQGPRICNPPPKQKA